MPPDWSVDLGRNACGSVARAYFSKSIRVDADKKPPAPIAVSIRERLPLIPPGETTPTKASKAEIMKATQPQKLNSVMTDWSDFRGQKIGRVLNSMTER